MVYLDYDFHELLQQLYNLRAYFSVTIIRLLMTSLHMGPSIFHFITFKSFFCLSDHDLQIASSKETCYQMPKLWHVC